MEAVATSVYTRRCTLVVVVVVVRVFARQTRGSRSLEACTTRQKEAKGGILDEVRQDRRVDARCTVVFLCSTGANI